MQQHGYRTATIGKGHLGCDWPIASGQKALFRANKGPLTEATDAHRAAWQATFSQATPGGPTTRGFDSYFGTDVPNWPPYCFIANGVRRQSEAATCTLACGGAALVGI